MYSFCAMYSLRMSFCSVPEIFFQSAPCFSATTRYIAQSTLAGELMVIDVVIFFEGDAVEQNLHIFERVDGHAALTDFAFAGRVVGVVAHERWQIEGNGESAAAVFEKIFVTLVRFFGRGEAGEHAHGPELAAVAGRVNAARVGRLAGITEVLLVIPIGGEISLGVKAADRSVRDRAETRVAMLVEVGAGGSADRFFGRLVERGRES